MKMVGRLIRKHSGGSGRFEDIPKSHRAAYKEELADLVTSLPAGGSSPVPCDLCGAMIEGGGNSGCLVINGLAVEFKQCVSCQSVQIVDSPAYWKMVQERFGDK